MRRSAERGQALPLLVVVLVLAAAVAVVVADLGSAAVQRARARTAADAAALAGAAEGEAAARSVAADNGAEVVSFAVAGEIVEVVVVLGDARARATAEGRRTTPGSASPALAAALARAGEVLGRPVPVVAVVEGGAAVEVDPAVAAELLAIAVDSGLCQRAATGRPVDFGPCPPSSPG